MNEPIGTPELINGIMAHLLRELREENEVYNAMEDPTYLSGSDEVNILLEKMYETLKDLAGNEISNPEEILNLIKKAGVDIITGVSVKSGLLSIVITMLDKDSEQCIRLLVQMKSLHECTCTSECTYQQYQALGRLNEITKTYLGILLNMPLVYNDIKTGEAQIVRK